VQLPVQQISTYAQHDDRLKGSSMNIVCKTCNNTYNLPDERLPQGRLVSFPCPSCKSKVTIDTRVAPETPADDLSERVVFKPLADSSESSLSSDDLKKKIIKKIDDLPPMPKVLFKAREVMADPKSSFKDVANVIETDQAIAAKILKVANSAYYGLSGMVNSIHQATVVLGQTTLEQVITMVSSSSLLGKRLKGYNLNAGVLWRHSLAVALCSRMIADKRVPSLASDAFSVGLIHDAGKLALDPYLEKKKSAVDLFFQNQGATFLEAERHVLGFDHTEIAQELCRKWKLPENHAEAMRFHHNPDEADNNQLAHIIYLANCIAKIAGYGSSMAADDTPLEAASMKALQLKQEDVDTISASLAVIVEDITASINV
jgi:HD-like signal output (HDOD) protein